jgi:hypothetical protein
VTWGTSENCVVISKTTAEPSGSTANRWKTPAKMENPPLRASGKKRKYGSGAGVMDGASMTVTGSQFPRRTRSFAFPEARPCGSLVASVTT